MLERDAYLDLAGRYPVVPVVRRVAAGEETPVSMYQKTGGGPWSFLLESVEGGTRWGRYSLAGCDPLLTVEVRATETMVRSAEGTVRGRSPVDDLRQILRDNRMPQLPGLPRFSGGLVGYFGYPSVSLFERVRGLRRESDGSADIRLFAPRRILAYDNLHRTIDLMVLTRPGDDPLTAFGDAQSVLDEMQEQLRGAVPPPVSAGEGAPAPGWGGFAPSVPRPRFEAQVSQAREAVLAGEAIQVVLSQSFTGECSLDPFAVYRALRKVEPTPYLFHLALPGEVIVGAGPEVLVRVEGGRVMVRPIAGTRPRGQTPAEDRALEAELLADEKERAEHVMLVDLGRNDLGRVARPGSVRVEESFVVERYSRVMHLVSAISAELLPSMDGLDVLAATFPAGTVSGAPKVRAMELIAELEDHPRGVYAGAVGYLGFDGNLDTCIAIRTLVFSEGRVTLRTGAGIVADSVPAREYEETLHKGAALLGALSTVAGEGTTEETPCCC